MLPFLATTTNVIDYLSIAIHTCKEEFSMIKLIQPSIKQNIWTLHRFGLTPNKLFNRLQNGVDTPKIICISIPKSGTHMLERLLCLHPSLYRKLLPTIHIKNQEQYGGVKQILLSLKPSQILITHLHHHPEHEQIIREVGIKSLFMIRDPRDLLVSDMLYIKRRSDHILHDHLSTINDTTECLSQLISGISEFSQYPSIAQRMSNFHGWLNSDSLLIRFENLIGTAGGGDDQRQWETLEAIFDHLNLPMQHHELLQLRQSMFSNASPTFRKGQIGGWKEYFTPELKQHFKKFAGQQLIDYGYEMDNNW